jgi:hypothetical protein
LSLGGTDLVRLLAPDGCRGWGVVIVGLALALVVVEVLFLELAPGRRLDDLKAASRALPVDFAGSILTLQAAVFAVLLAPCSR